MGRKPDRSRPIHVRALQKDRARGDLPAAFDRGDCVRVSLAAGRGRGIPMVADGRIAVRRDLFRITADLRMLARLLRAVGFDPMDQQVVRWSSARDTYGL